jgi:phosphatidylglycerol lysyltransferase
MAGLIKTHSGSSEDFFKLWPHDKAYFFNPERSAGLAYRVTRGVALCVADPVGPVAAWPGLLQSFMDYCYTNDWEAALIHTLPTHGALYERLGFETQKIGEEAVVDTGHFVSHIKPTKYFRHIIRKFDSQHYSYELLKPPHSAATLRRLQEISDDWLKVPGRTERGFMMGYYSAEYMQQCPVMVVRDEAATMQAFINLLPTIDKTEANFELLRHTRGSAGNINDYLLTNFITYLHQQGFARINLGLCPLSGLQAETPTGGGAVDNVLRFVYANGNRFYSFQGLRRFKTKYEPTWRSRFIVYRGGLPGFTRTLNALLRAMRVRPAR